MRPPRQSDGAVGGAAERRAVNGLSPHWRAAYVGLGSNLAGPSEQVREAMTRLAAVEGTRVEARSRLYLSDPMGPQDQPQFVNAVAGLLTRLDAPQLLQALLGIERAMGRDRQARWGPRCIDLDLLWMTGEQRREPSLTLPHPGVTERNFVLYPLDDIAPTLLIPGHGRVANLKSRVGGAGIVVLETG